MEVQIVPVETIKIPASRQRTEDAGKHIEALCASILENGLLHAPVATPDRVLVAGFCRVSAIAKMEKDYYFNGEKIPAGNVPLILTEKTDETSLYALELEENLRRKNLSVIEQAEAIARYHELQKNTKPLQTIADTADALAQLRNQATLASTPAEVADSLLIAQVKDRPEMKEAKTRSQAVRIAKRLIEQDFRSSLGIDQLGTAIEGERRWDIQQGDSLEILCDLGGNVFDGIITDPPYGIDADSFGTAGFLKGEGHEYSDTEEFALKCYEVLAREGFRICREQAHLYAFCDIRNFPALMEIFSYEGWRVWPTPLIWYKGTTAHAPRPEHGPKRTYETILFASKGDMKTQRLGQDVLSFPAVSSSQKLHGAEKPIELIEELISMSFPPGSTLIDPFVGSGATVIAGFNKNVEVLGIELNEKQAAIATDRLRRRIEEK